LFWRGREWGGNLHLGPRFLMSDCKCLAVFATLP
jgi:hypothetical protein